MFSLQFSEIHEQIRELARNFTREEIAPTAIQRDISTEFPHEILKKAGELGFLGMCVDPKYGGAGLDTLALSIVIEEFSKADASSSVVISVQNSLVDWILETFGTEYQKETFLTPLASGQAIGAYCLSEPGAGSDARDQQTTAEKDGNGWILNGTKNWITNGRNADTYIVFAQTDAALKHKGIACFIVPKGTPGFEPGLKEDKLGLRSSDTTSIGLINVRVPEENLIGSVGEGFYIAMKGLTGGRIGIASQALGIAEGAFELAAKYSAERKTMGSPINNHQAIQMKLAQMSMKISAAQMLVYKAAWMKDQGMDVARASSEAKLFASTIANEVTKEAIQIHGGYGYVREYQVERMYRDAKVTEIYEGTSEIQHLVIAREIIKQFS